MLVGAKISFLKGEPSFQYSIEWVNLGRHEGGHADRIRLFFFYRSPITRPRPN